MFFIKAKEFSNMNFLLIIQMHPASKLILKATFIQFFLQINIFLITYFHNELIVQLLQDGDLVLAVYIPI